MYSFPNFEPVHCSMPIPNYCFLTCVQDSQEAGWCSGIPISWRIFHFIVIHTVKDFSIVNEPEVDVFLEFPCFVCDPKNVVNLISGSSVSSKSSLYIWKFLVHILLKLSLEDFEHDLTGMWNEWNCVHSILWHCPSMGLEWKLTFSSPVATAVFQICWHIVCSTLEVSSFIIWSSSARIPSPPLALSIVMFPKAHLTPHSRMSGSNWVTTLSWLPGSLRTFLYSSSVYSGLLLSHFSRVWLCETP